MENDENTWIASIDIGKKNFCFYIEEISPNKLSSIEDIHPNDSRFNEDGTATEKMKCIIDKASLVGKTILHLNTDLTCNTNKNKYLDSDIYYNMNDCLDKYKEYFDKCSIIVIEAQLKRNTMAIKLGQHCYSYFCIKYGKEKILFEFPSYKKTLVLGAEKTFEKQYKNGKNKYKAMDQRSRKKWSVEQALNILKKRGEENTLNNIKSKTKRDDLCDTICQLLAFKIEYYIFKNHE